MAVETDKEVKETKEEEKKKETKEEEKMKEYKEEEKKKDPKKEEKKGKCRTLSYDERSEKKAQLQRLFELPALEPLVDDFSCAYQKTFLRQGRLYILQSHLAFYSMLGPRLLLGYAAIQAIREAKTLELFNNAIVVTTADGQSHFFTSFLTRDKALATVNEAHRQHQQANAPDPPAAGHLPRGLSDTGVESDAGSVRVRSSGSCSDDEESAEGVEEDEKAEHGAEAKGKPKHPRRFKALPPSTAQAAAIQPNATMHTIEEALNSLGETGFCPVADILKKPMKMNIQFPKGARLEDVYAALLGAGATLFTAYHQRQGDKVVELQDWVQRTLPDGQGVWAGSRQAVFSTEVSMPKRAWVSAYEQHAFCFLQLPKAKVLVLQSATRTPEVMYGDCFRAESLLCWREVSEGEIVLDIYCGLHFVKNTMMRRLIESKALAELARSYDLWLEVALGMVTDALACRPVSPAAGSSVSESWMKRREKKGMTGRKNRPSPEASPRCSGPTPTLEALGFIASADPAPARAAQRRMLVFIVVSLVLQWLVFHYINSEILIAEQLLEATEHRCHQLQNQTAALRFELSHGKNWTARMAYLLETGRWPGEGEGMASATEELMDWAVLQRTVRAAINVLAPCDAQPPPVSIPDPATQTSEALLLLARQQQLLTFTLLAIIALGVVGLWFLLMAIAGYAVYRYRVMNSRSLSCS